MKNITYILLLTALLTGCVRDKTTREPKAPEQTWNNFDFSTHSATTLSIDYDTYAAVYFEVYDTLPVRENATGTAYESLFKNNIYNHFNIIEIKAR